MFHTTSLSPLVVLFMLHTTCLKAETETIRKGSDICSHEKSIVAKRMDSTYTYKKKFVGQEFDKKYNPRVALITSGGGHRAAIAALATYTFLYNIIDYWMALSGSTWTACALCAHQLETQKQPDYLETFKKYLKENLSSLSYSDKDIHTFIQLFVSKKVLGLPITLTDIWGCILYLVYLKNTTIQTQKYFSHTQEILADGLYPFPIVTSSLEAQNKLWWTECNPFEKGVLLPSEYTQYWVDAKFWGKTFDGGIMTKNTPEISIQELMAMCGSAFAVPFNSIVIMMIRTIIQGIKDYWLYGNGNDAQIMQLWEDLEALKDQADNMQRAASIPNFMKNLEGSVLPNDTMSSEVDAGVVCGIPIVSALRPERKIDIIIVCEASSEKQTFNLTYMQTEAEKLGYEIPAVTKEHFKKLLKKEPFVIYDKDNPKTPIIVFFPIPNLFPITKMTYTPEEFDQLYDYTLKLLSNNKQLIKDAITLSIKKKQPADTGSYKRFYFF